MTTPTAAEILSGLDAAAILAGIRRWVEIETPTDDPAAVNRLMDLVAAECAALGGAVGRFPGSCGRGDHLRVRFWPADAPGVLVASHLDTVWAHGTLATRPFRIEGDRAHGPGVLDMKGGAYLALHAVAEICRRGWRPRLPVTLLFTSDEEVGSATSRALIEDTARAARHVLVPEPGKLPGGSVVTARKGWGRFDLTVHGRAAHAGAWHEEGRSAIAELARHVLALEA
ncbi:MAG TPA: M20/M25/M40 family metallo-hydrolase, partial [Geminicoccaceae bacterium]|nr:M20/M25/M40 family metallo-hydrolase [Geminicoccaceae bacterium]